MMATAGRSQASFIFITVALDAVGIGITVPVMPDLLKELSGLSFGEAAIWGGYLSFTYALMQFLFSPTLGALSDRYGRRPVLLISLATLGLDYILLALAPSLWLLFVGRIIAGIAGATYSTATAYIADVTTPDKRAAAFGLVGAGFGVGFVFGPVIGGLIGELGTRAPFYAAAVVAFANFAYGWFVLPESLAPAKRRSFHWARANPLGSLRQIARVPMVAFFIGATFLYSLAHNVYPAVWSFYTKEAFAWSNAQIGISLAAFGICFAIVQGGLIRMILARLGEWRTVVLGFALEIVGLIGVAFAGAGWVVYAFLPLAALGGIVMPAMNGLMSNRTPDDAQGELQGAVASAQALTSIISPLIMTRLFGVFTTGEGPYLPGAPFLAAACMMALALIPFRFGLRRQPAEGSCSPGG